MAKLMIEGGATVSGTDHTLRETARAAFKTTAADAAYYSDYNSSAQSATGMTKITNCEKTLTTHGGKVIVFASAPIYQSGGTGAVYVYVDGVSTKGMIWTSNTTSKQSYSGMVVLTDIPAGTHTFALYFRPQSASYTAYVSNYTNSCICVFELPALDDSTDTILVPTEASVEYLSEQLDNFGTGVFTYSTTQEVPIGTWIDGKTIYRKVYNTGNVSNATKTVNHGISNLSWVVNAYGFIKTSGSWYQLSRVSTSAANQNIAIVVSASQILLVGGNDASFTQGSYVVLEYTKG